MRILISEYLIMLLSGTGIGLVSALVAILPSFLSPAFQFPGGFVFFLLSLVFLSGILWIIIPVKYAVRKSIIKVLKQE
jgi:hypothetical protein